MKYIMTFALALAFSASVALAGEKTLTGQIACPKCTCKKTKKCGPAFVQKDKDGKVTVLLITGKGAKPIAPKEICKPGTKDAVGMASNAGLSDPEFLTTKHAVPDSDDVLFASKLVQPDAEDVLEFTAPTEPGDYPYICTYPGHWAIMNGVMKVAE